MALLAAMAMMGACTFDAKKQRSEECSESYVCPIGETCVSGRCEPVGSADADGSRTGDASMDGGGGCREGESRPCGTSNGECEEGTQRCEGGAWGECEGAVEPSAEVCNGEDDDCDGLVDEDDDGRVLVEACGADTCPGRGLRLCEGGAWGECRRDEFETCDGSDTNCDEAADNLSPCHRACPGGGTAVGTLDCSGAAGECVMPDEICGDGIDNDCDGEVDEDDGDCSEANVHDDMAFVPGGAFMRGASDDDGLAAADEFPRHIVDLDPFYIDKYEVTRREYYRCLADGACEPLTGHGCESQGLEDDAPSSPPDDPDKPVLCLEYEDAVDVCHWLGKRLPTAAEWEKAARGPFPRDRRFPWGDRADRDKAVAECHDGVDACLADVDTYEESQTYYGARHMAGNAAEIVSDYYDADYYDEQVRDNPEQTDDRGEGREIRGGNFKHEFGFVRTSNRVWQDGGSGIVEFRGVRCALAGPAGD